MGRKKSYDRDVLIERAMVLFWQFGYDGTSITALTDHLGVNKFGLYAEFGSKQGLYLEALQRYTDTVVSDHFGRLETETAGLDDILAVLAMFSTAPEPEPIRLGCMMCNAATERATHDMMSAALISGFVTRLIAAHQNALRNADRDGELMSGIDIPGQAALLVAQLLGIFVLRRSQSDPTVWRCAGEQAQCQVMKLRRLPAG
jgi:TetR/AcrR family transcriptional regulator, transcriptional repressor for nem operon